MSNVFNGGPAFACQGTQWANGNIDYAQQGMSLRDYFAAKALNGLCAQPDTSFVRIMENTEELADLSYKLADALIARMLRQ